MSRTPNAYNDYGAASYAGDDRAAAETFNRIGRFLRNIMDPPLVRIIAKRAGAGCYDGYEIDGPLPQDGAVTHRSLLRREPPAKTRAGDQHR